MSFDLELKIAKTATPNVKSAKEEHKIKKILMGIVGSRAVNVRILMTYTKVTDTKKRVQGEDFEGKEGLVVNAVKGVIASVKETKKGNIVFTVKDENRAKNGKPFGWTTCRIEGVIAVSLEGWEKGPALKG